ncbi:MAG TPA: hypothetical protein VKT82_03995 [Ktedonobacterales bacterium]|nr:hypothetical protein [Ktedonobacterales bacterium]
MRRRSSIFLAFAWLLFLAGCGGNPAPAAPTIHEFSLPQPNSSAGEIAAGPDGNLWLTLDDKIVRMTPAGQVTTFDLPTSSTFAWKIALGPDHNLWFTEYESNQIGRLAPAK